MLSPSIATEVACARNRFPSAIQTQYAKPITLEFRRVICQIDLGAVSIRWPSRIALVRTGTPLDDFQVLRAGHSFTNLTLEFWSQFHEELFPICGYRWRPDVFLHLACPTFRLAGFLGRASREKFVSRALTRPMYDAYTRRNDAQTQSTHLSRLADQNVSSFRFRSHPAPPESYHLSNSFQARSFRFHFHLDGFRS